MAQSFLAPDIVNNNSNLKIYRVAHVKEWQLPSHLFQSPILIDNHSKHPITLTGEIFYTT